MEATERSGLLPRSGRRRFGPMAMAAVAGAACLGASQLRRGPLVASSLDWRRGSDERADADAAAPPRMQLQHFGKWTIPCGSRSTLAQNADAAWYGYNMIERVRENWTLGLTFEDSAVIGGGGFDYLGPTGCSSVSRRWLSARAKPSDDEIHFVWSAENGVVQEAALAGGRTVALSMEEYGAALAALHDATGLEATSNQFSGNRYGFFDGAGIEFALQGARENFDRFGWPYALRVGRAVLDAPGGPAGGVVPLYVVRSRNADGRLFETAAIAASEASKAAFDADGAFDEGLVYPADIPGWYQSGTNCMQDTPYIVCEPPRHGDDEDYVFGEEGYGRWPVSRAAYSHIASPDPQGDAAWLMRYFQHADVSAPVAAAGGAGDDVWLKFHSVERDGAAVNATAYYVHLAAPAADAAPLELPRGQGSLDLSEFAAFQRALRGGLDDDVYDAFLDEHIGVTVDEPFSTYDPHYGTPWTTLVSMHDDDRVPLLTRREVVTNNPDAYATKGQEKFSAFASLPYSQYSLQIRNDKQTQEAISAWGMPVMCDWDFCRDEGFGNYRDAEDLYLDPATCGFSSLS